MSDILGKISSYNIFNNLLPGILFAAVSDRFTSYSVIQDDALVGLFLYYFIGLVISRLGSLLLEPLLKNIGVLTYAEYSSFVTASKIDSKLDALSETNNMYRTLASLLVCLMLFIAFDKATECWPVVNVWAPYVSIVALFALFIYSWKKQASYIASRIDGVEKD